MSTPDIVLAQIGCGYWGPNLLRNFSNLAGCKVKWLVDASADRRSFVSKNFPHVKVSDSVNEVMHDPEVDAIIIATPAKSHFELASLSLKNRKHVFVEKPLATSVEEVEALDMEARAAKRLVMVGHTFLYNTAVQYVKKLIDTNELGDIRYIYSQRLNLGRIRSDIDALWNFAPHDISIIQYWLGDPIPVSVERRGMDYIQAGVEDVVFLNIKYPNKVMAHIHVSWLDPQKVRKMVVVGTKKMIIYDDVAEDKISIYDKGVDRKSVLGENMDYDTPPLNQFSYRSGDILLPKIKYIEPLHAEAEHFIECVRKGIKPMTDIAHARNVISILEGINS